jgi:hypothetical protein
MPLNPRLAVPVGFAVAQEKEAACGHGGMLYAR